MNTFELNIFDDRLYNADDLKKFLEDNPGRIALDTRKEGPSLKYCGVIDILDEHCRSTGRDKETITIVTVNQVEEYEYPKTTLTHAWWNACVKSYNRASSDRIDLPRKKFACLIGRKNPIRLAILYWLKDQDCLLSSMTDVNFRPENINIDSVVDWTINIDNFKSWVYDMDIGPLDSYTVSDQYKAVDPNDEIWGTTHMALLKFYHNFDIEIAVETWTMGDTFSPTEKTIRPILAGKPFIMYGPKDYMKNLRDLGFKSYAECWDEDYDNYSGLDRWKRMQDLIRDLSTRDDYMEKAVEIAEYNKKYALDPIRNW